MREKDRGLVSIYITMSCGLGSAYNCSINCDESSVGRFTGLSCVALNACDGILVAFALVPYIHSRGN